MNEPNQNPQGWTSPGAAARGSRALDLNKENEPFTAEMRDRQARGKDPYEASDGSSDSTGTSADDRGGRGEPFAVLDRRRVAAQVLNNPELLMTAAQRDDESIPATRLRYTRMLCDFDDPPPAAQRRTSRNKRPRAKDPSTSASGPQEPATHA
ncbi:hypothetical protein F4778DRAFT_452833 [Xylariomycetidae sp. FL2044]|nr:hypothetical protein F4778DRAFT_452833 [Xylariomycetidae sp. FL2044]